MSDKARTSRFGNGISRRAFMGTTTTTFAALALSGCAPSAQPSQNEPEELAATGGQKSALPEEGGKWVPAACWLNCGGKCYNTAYVVDGVVTHQKTDDTHEDSIEMPQQRSCPRGRSLRHLVYAPDRILYPMKRKSWSLEEPHGELRGKDEWERISWDEALDYVAAALKSAIAKDGNRSILYLGWPFQDHYVEWMSALGGYTTINDTSSYGAYNRTCTVTGSTAAYDGLDRYGLQESDFVILYGCNPAWSSPGQPNLYLWEAKEAGAQFVFVGPSYNESADLYDAKWIRVRPGTDGAFMIAVAYEMIALDQKQGGVIDWDFLNRCTLGFDADHMPPDATLDENFQDYVLGTYDGIPKTAEWATEICGTPVEDIKWYAQTMSMENKVSVMHSFAFARCNDADDMPQLFMTIGAMGGHMGKPGHSTSGVYHAGAANGGQNLIAPGSDGAPHLDNPVDDVVDAPDLWRAILDGTYQYNNAAMSDPSTVEQRDLPIHVIFNLWRNSLQTIQGIKTGIEAFRSVECIVTQGYDFNATAQHSDILLPCTTKWEMFGTYFYQTLTGREFFLFPSKVIEPLAEAKQDRWISSEIMKRLGVDPSTAYPVSEEQGYFNVIAGATVATEDGSGYEPLVTITQEDLDELGFEGEPQNGRIPYAELMEKGIYQVSRTKGDSLGNVPMAAYREDPEGNPLTSKSGKLEIYCQAKADGVNAMGRSTIKPYPTYRPALHGYEESFSDWDSKTKGDYPFQMYNPHYLRRAHTGFDNVSQLREVLTNPVFLNASDAAEKGIADGDTVRIFNGYGQCLRHASLTERLMPGCVALPHGTWCNLNSDETMDNSGSDNWMLAPDTSGAGISGYNTNLVDYEKWTADDLPEDCERTFSPAGDIE